MGRYIFLLLLFIAQFNASGHNVHDPLNNHAPKTLTSENTNLNECNGSVLYYMLLPYKQFVHSITSDNGTEFYEHKWIAHMLNTSYYFAHPYASWERGLNEYTNGLIRQYIPKKESFANFSDKDIENFQHKINRRPRKLLNFDVPKNRFFLFIRACLKIIS